MQLHGCMNHLHTQSLKTTTTTKKREYSCNQKHISATQLPGCQTCSNTLSYQSLFWHNPPLMMGWCRYLPQSERYLKVYSKFFYRQMMKEKQTASLRRGVVFMFVVQGWTQIVWLFLCAVTQKASADCAVFCTRLMGKIFFFFWGNS